MSIESLTPRQKKTVDLLPSGANIWQKAGMARAYYSLNRAIRAADLGPITTDDLETMKREIGKVYVDLVRERWCLASAKGSRYFSPVSMRLYESLAKKYPI